MEEIKRLQSNAPSLEEYFILFILIIIIIFLKASGRSHSQFVSEAARELPASYVTSADTNTHTHTHRGFFLLFLTYIPNNCTSFHFPASQAPLQASLTHSTLLSPSIVLLHIHHVCRRSNTTLCDNAGPGIHVDPR